MGPWVTQNTLGSTPGSATYSRPDRTSCLCPHVSNKGKQVPTSQSCREVVTARALSTDLPLRSPANLSCRCISSFTCLLSTTSLVPREQELDFTLIPRFWYDASQMGNSQYILARRTPKMSSGSQSPLARWVHGGRLFISLCLHFLICKMGIMTGASL